MPFFALLLLSAEAHGGEHAAPPLIDFDGTVILQFVLFMIALVIMSKTVFRPFLAVQADREEKIDGERERAAEFDGRVATHTTTVEQRLRQARAKGMDERAAIRAEAAAAERATLDRAQAEAASLLEATRKASEKAAQEASAKLKAETSSLAHAMASRLLGREPAKPREVV